MEDQFNFSEESKVSVFINSNACISIEFVDPYDSQTRILPINSKRRAMEIARALSKLAKEAQFNFEIEE